MVTPTPEKEIKSEQLVGNDSDEHGCKASEGYSWCENKQICLSFNIQTKQRVFVVVR